MSSKIRRDEDMLVGTDISGANFSFHIDRLFCLEESGMGCIITLDCGNEIKLLTSFHKVVLALQ